VKLVLDNEIGWQQSASGEEISSVWIAGTVESLLIVTLDSPKERAYMAGPWHRSEFIDRCDEKAG
jgi:hypothetical protein